MSEQESRGINKKLEELEAKINWFYGEEFRLDEATAKYKEAKGLAEEVLKDLDGLQNEIKVLAEDFTKEK
ncbi:hypothetical protein IJI02_00835 [Candidatus Saccharibacteria bacterium]|nr:hypothetical protein [Candidatus Saccharibacteria bacterium]